MKKLYLQKLIHAVKYVLIFLVVYIFGANVLVTMANFFKDTPFLQSLVILGVPGVIVFIMATVKRGKDKEKCRAYKAALGDKRGKLTAELAYVLTSPDYIAELLAALTYVLLYIAFALISKGTANFLFRLGYDLAVGAVILAVYAIGNLISRLLVQKRFRGDGLM